MCKSTRPKALSPAGPSQRQNQRWPVRMVEVRVNRCRPPTQHQFIGLIHLVAILALNTSRAMELNVEFPARVSNQYRHQDGRYVNNAHYRRNCTHTHRIDLPKKVCGTKWYHLHGRVTGGNIKRPSLIRQASGCPQSRPPGLCWCPTPAGS